MNYAVSLTAIRIRRSDPFPNSVPARYRQSSIQAVYWGLTSKSSFPLQFASCTRKAVQGDFYGDGELRMHIGWVSFRLLHKYVYSNRNI